MTGNGGGSPLLDKPKLDRQLHRVRMHTGYEDDADVRHTMHIMKHTGYHVTIFTGMMIPIPVILTETFIIALIGAIGIPLNTGGSASKGKILRCTI